MSFFKYGVGDGTQYLNTSAPPPSYAPPAAGGMPGWLSAMGASELPGGGFGGNKSFRVGNDVYTGAYTPGDVDHGVGAGYVGDFYKYGYNPQAWAGMGSVLNGTGYERFNTAGNSLGKGLWEGIEDKDFATDNAVVAIVGSILGGAALAGTGAGGAAATAGGGTGAATGADLAAFYGGLDGGATLGGGASVAGGSSLGAVGATGAGTAAGVSGFGDAGTMYGGANTTSAASLGGGASVNGGSALGGTSAMGAGGSSWTDMLQKGVGNMEAKDWLGLATTALGAYGGSQGQNASTSSTRSMDPRMDALFYGGLAPATMNAMSNQLPAAQAAGNQMMSVGSGLLGQKAPTTATNPYLKSIADDMQMRTSDLLGQNNMQIQGNAVGVGGLGGSRQGVAQGLAASKAADYLQGNVAGLYGNAYTGDQNRLLQQQTLGAGLLSQGLDTQFQPLKNTGNIFSPFNGFGTTTNSSETGGGWQGALGGALGAAQFSKNQGWW